MLAPTIQNTTLSYFICVNGMLHQSQIKYCQGLSCFLLAMLGENQQVIAKCNQIE